MDVIITPDDCTRLISVKLPNPKDESPTIYYHDEDNISLYESTKFEDKFRSWFLDNTLAQNGKFTMLTRIDPLFIFVPQIKKFASEQFRSIDDICASFLEHQQAQSEANKYSKLEYALSPDINWESVCDIKQHDDEIYIKYNEEKILDWLVIKYKKTMTALNIPLTGNQEPSTATLMSYAFDLVNLYVAENLSSKLKARIGITSQSVAPTTSGPQSRTNSNQTQDKFKRKNQEPAQPKRPPLTGGIMKFFKKES